MPQLVKILALDGGGIRGIIAATILAELEERLGEPVAKHFDLITGTSTGGILALGLCVPGDDPATPKYAARELVSLYSTQGGRIFSRPWVKRVLDRFSIFDEKYDTDGLERVLLEKFGDTRLKDAVTDVLVTSYAIESRQAWFFSRQKARDRGPDFDFPMTYVARATSAAPTYFEPLEFRGGGKHDGLVDGGVFANNPTMCGWAEARARWGDDVQTFVVSIGTGNRVAPYSYREARNWGLAKWAKPVLDIVFDGVSQTVDYQMKQLCNREGAPPRYYRFQPELPPGMGAMDNVGEGHVRGLAAIAQSYVAEDETRLQAVCDALRELAPVAG